MGKAEQKGEKGTKTWQKRMRGKVGENWKQVKKLIKSTGRRVKKSNLENKTSWAPPAITKKLF